MSRRGDAAFRFIMATRRLDRMYARLDRLRSAAILAVADDAALDRFNAWAYARSGAYQPDAEDFRRELFPWEERVIERFFPDPPGRILVGGAGAGREPLCLAARGYEVVAFEPAAPLAEGMAAAARAEGVAIDAYRGGYERPEGLERVSDGSVRALADLGPFDAAVAGWGSYSHLRTRRARIATFESLAGATTGPVLVSFIAVRPEGDGRALGRLERRLLGRRGREPADRFSMHMGFQHPVNEGEVRALAGEAGLDVLELEFGADTLAPFVVLRAPRATE